MKFYLILVGLLCYNFCHSQDSDQDYEYSEDDYEYYEDASNRNVIEGGFNYLIPLSDFKRKQPDNHLGAEISYLRQINYSRIFLGFSVSTRRIDAETIVDFEPDLDLQARMNSSMFSVLGRVYPQLYLSIFEFFADAGAGMHTLKTITRDYDKLSEEYFNQNTLLVSRDFFFYGGGGFHVSLDESWFLTGKTHTLFGPTTKFHTRIENPGPINFPEEVFEITNSAFRATTISLSLTFIF